MRRFGIGWMALVIAAPAAAQVSQNVSLLAQQNLYGPGGQSYASCYGWTSPGGAEFAILGVSTGTSIVDVTIPTAPVEKAFIPGPMSSWREMKTHGNYLYVVSEGAGMPNPGLQIIDLAATPPVLVTTFTATFNTAHTITIVDGFAYCSGARLSGSQVGIRILDLSNPVAPVDVGGWNGFYTHDCQVRGNRLYAACINNSLLAIVDITNKSAPSMITNFTWAGNKAHNCDLTTDGNYLYTTDETAGGRLRIFDISNLANIQQVANFTPNPTGIVHNVHIRGDRAYVAYYTEGVRVLDISDPVYPVEIGYYDTWPGASGGFNGCWAVYPYAVADQFYASDISTGLYILRFVPTSGAVRGHVTDFDTAMPINGATTKIVGGPSGATNAAGFYKLYHTPGVQKLVTSLFGYESDSTDVSLILNTTITQDVVLERLPGGPLGGTVRDANTMTPIAGATLSLARTPLTDDSDGAGAYVLDPVPYGVYALDASRFGYAPQQRTVTVSIQDPLDPVVEDFALQPAALAHDFEAGASSWTRVAPPNQATAGLWIWANPIGSGGGAVQPEDDHSVDPGQFCWVTANAASSTSGVGDADVDNGATILQSPVLDLSAMSNPVLSYWRWFTNDAGSNPGTDTLRVEISNNNGSTWKVVEKVLQSQSAWVNKTVAVSSLLPPTTTMRVRFIAEDLGGGSVVEAAMDDFMIYDQVSTTSAPPVRLANRLEPNVPNPFNPSTTIRFTIERAGTTSLRIHDIRGRLVRSLWNGPLVAGSHTAIWNGRDDRDRAVASGVYVLRLEAGEFRSARRIVLTK
jgi:choice-of-anchor B domain-containing protein